MSSKTAVTPEAYVKHLRAELKKSGLELTDKSLDVIYLASPRTGNPMGFSAGQDGPVLVCRRHEYQAVLKAQVEVDKVICSEPPFLAVGYWPEAKD